MPKLKPFNIKGMENPENAEPKSFKDVPTPPKGRYVTKVKRMTHGEIKNGDNKGATRFGILLELVGGEKGKHEKHIGYGFWYGINVTTQGAGYVNAFLDALAGGDPTKTKQLRRDFWKGNIVIDDDGHVQKIGSFKIGSPEGVREIEVTTKVGPDYQGNKVGQIVSVLVPAKSESSEDEDEDDEYEEDDDPLDSDEDEDEDEEDEDEEPF